MNKQTIYKCLLLCTLSLASSYASPAAMYTGEPTINKLSASLKQTHLFQHPPITTAQKTDLYSYDKKNRYYSHYQMYPGKSQGNIIKYWTREIIPAGWRFPGIRRGQQAIVHGRGISLGGIFWPLEKMTATNRQGKQVYFNKIDIYKVKPISGKLFPLQVGNDLKFHFERLHIRRLGDKTKRIHDIGIMEYKVIKQYQGYPYSNVKLPGNVYRIEVWEKTQNHPRAYLTDLYDYSEKLGWYVTDFYFTKNNRKFASYYLQRFS